jgi:signal transduction histidine kinase
LEFLLFCFVLFKLVEIPCLIHILFQMNRIREGGRRVAGGDYSHPIDTKYMFWEFKQHAQNINNVGDGIAIAVDEKMKSERFKTELITNVSHDIKTPLTSIINYVDLLKKEPIENPTAQEYLGILDRQSARLKKLIEDLMEASKASTGNLPVHLELCDATVMLTQVVGEFAERAEANALDIVVESPEPPINIMADGRHLWRVIDNLMSNICKYAQPGTRVYINLERAQGQVVMTFRNISRDRLNISSDELMARFVRGDSSRNTEGNGLGLSIARSLTELMDGTLALQIDGDLFKAILSFEETMHN